MAKRYQRGNLSVLLLLCTASDYLFGIFWPLCCLSDNTITKRYQRGNQKPYVEEEEQTTQWPKDTKEVIRSISFGHCDVCSSSSMYGFWLPLWYLLVIVLSVLLLLCTASDYLFGIFWPLCCLFFFYVRILNQRGNQKPYIEEEEQTTQWPKDTKEVIRSRT
jgi:uncharacterized protein YxeA